MNSFRLAAACLSTAAMILACSDADTIVSVNISAGDGKAVGIVTKVDITISQGSNAPVKQTLNMACASPKLTDDPCVPIQQWTVTAEDPDGDGPLKPPVHTAVADSFYRRIPIPGGYGDGKATVEVVGTTESGMTITPKAVDFDLSAHATTAAFIKLANPVDTTAMGGMAATGGAASGGAASGGAASGGAATGGAGGAGGAAGGGGVGG